MNELSANRRFWLFWVLAFLSFPIAGVLAIFVVPVTTPLRAVIAGAIAVPLSALFSGLFLSHDCRRCLSGG